MLYCHLPPIKTKKQFFPFMADVVVRYEKVIMVGDINFPIDDATNNFDQITF